MGREEDDQETTSSGLLTTMAVFYWASFFISFFLIIPMFLVQSEFEGILYGDEERNGCSLFALVGRYDFVQLRGSEMSVCRVAVFFPLTAMIIGLVLAILHSVWAWKAVAEMDEEIQYKMWAWPWLVLDFIVFAFMVVCASFTSAGFAQTCEGIRRHLMGMRHWYEQSESCFTFIGGNGTNRVSLAASVYLSIAVYWILVLIWLGLVILQVVKVRRNARVRDRIRVTLYGQPPTPETAL